MPLHDEIIEHLERLDIIEPEDVEGLSERESSAIEILSKHVVWPQTTRFDTCFDLWREWLQESGIGEAADWSDDDLLESSFSEGPAQAVGLRFGGTVPLDFYTGVNPEVSTWWSEDSSHLYFLEENPDDATDPFVTILDSEEVEDSPHRSATVSQLLAILEPQ